MNTTSSLNALALASLLSVSMNLSSAFANETAAPHAEQKFVKLLSDVKEMLDLRQWELFISKTEDLQATSYELPKMKGQTENDFQVFLSKVRELTEGMIGAANIKNYDSAIDYYESLQTLCRSRIQKNSYVPPDNTAKNERDARGETKTPLDQGGSQSDIDITSSIRSKIMSTPGLSVNGRNVKIVTLHGKVILRGPVDSNTERLTIRNIAVEFAGLGNVENQLEVVPVQ